ncbi:VCBS repeat-containing protein [Phycicoccus sp. Root563]|uniref:FG-GAP repeat domain-containing protein n=1 Tax=Phycicoccus sp. Root563 TaxID=1736562 RepID=UPI0009E9CE5E|nr:VCBS repeat-containing protein [Phycicoccus sp. Root563]
MARRRVRGIVAVVGGVVATLVAGLLTATPASAAAGPVITSISVSTNAVKAPGEVVLSYTATTTAPVDEALAGYKDPAGRLYSVNLSKGTSGSGTRKVPDGVQNGTWTLQYVFLTYSPNDFTYACNPSYASTNAKCTETRDLSPYDVVVSGSTEDFEAPVLTSIWVSPTKVEPGTPVTMRFAAHDLHPVVKATFTWVHGAQDEHFSLTSTDPAELAAGAFTRTVPHLQSNGGYVLSSVVLEDPNGFASRYAADGTIGYTAPAGIFFPQPTRPRGTHSIPFSASGLTVANSYYDGPGPVLARLAVTSSAVSGGTATATYSTTLTSSTLRSISALYLLDGDPGVATSLWSEDGRAAGSVTRGLPQRVGTYRLQRVVLLDAAMRRTEYTRDGRVLDERGKTIGEHALDLAAEHIVAKPSKLDVSGRSRPQSIELGVSTMPDEAQDLTSYRVVVNPGGRVVTVPVTGEYSKVVVPSLRNGTTYTLAVTPQSKIGPGPTTTVSLTPMISGNVWGAGDVNIDRRDDLFARLPAGQVRLYRGAGFPKFKAATTVTDLPSSRNFPSGRIYGYTAFLTINQDGGLEGNMVDRDGKSLGSTISGTGWGSMRSIDGTADFSGDGLPDIVAVTSTGAMRLYKGNGQGRFAAGTQIGTGWGSMVRVFVPGDVTGDRKADVMAVDATGVLWIYRGNGRGGFLGRVKVGPGWGGMGALFSARDANGDSRGDLGAITMNGELRFYKGRGNGTFTGATVAGTGWGSFL